MIILTPGLAPPEADRAGVLSNSKVTQFFSQTVQENLDRIDADVNSLTDVRRELKLIESLLLIVAELKS